MSLKKLIDLANSQNTPRKLTPQEEKEWRERIRVMDEEIAERHRQRIPTQEQLNRAIDYGSKYP